jgi:hypothetical protein
MDETNSLLPLDSRFAVKISESMDLRNQLRSGLVEAQGRDADRIPLFVSWPEWLEDGIVCLYDRDLHELLRSAVRDTAGALSDAVGRQESDGENDSPEPPPSIPGVF